MQTWTVLYIYMVSYIGTAVNEQVENIKMRKQPAFGSVSPRCSSWWTKCACNWSWQSILSTIVLKLLNAIYFPLCLTGCFIEWIVNFITFNNGLFNILIHFMLFRYGILDPREELLDPAAPYKEPNSVAFVDLAIMASKLAYESEEVQKYVVDNVWKMKFQKFYNCWNDKAQADTTQAFVFTDKKADAEAIFLAFRGTEPFNSQDWATDFDFDFMQLEEGGVHIGFLEALGLVNREQRNTLAFFKKNCSDLKSSIWRFFDNHGDEDKILTGLVKSDANVNKTLAFDAINKDLMRLLQENPKAKLFITGHSLGGALAILFAGILMYKERIEKEDNVLRRLSSIHTFGQPRFCKRDFARFMERQMEKWNIDYYRIVYCNDMVCRVPFDDPVFNFKHVGSSCYYYDSFFREKNLEEPPNRNFFSRWYIIPMWLNALWELVRGLVLGKMDNYREGIPTILLRIVGLFHPGVSAHLPVNYVNAVRLGPAKLYQDWPAIEMDRSVGPKRGDSSICMDWLHKLLSRKGKI